MLENLKPERVFYYFEEISKIPRGSGNTKQISDYCVEFAKKHNLQVYQDKLNNVIIKKPATAGREGDTGVILQGHLDMVCEKTPDSSHDFFRDGIELLIEDGFVTANKTTLGADDGVAVAMSLAVLESDTISHPSLEVIFTVDEEVGMDGAKEIDLSDITGKYVMNLDCDMDGIAFAGCAGGVRGDFVFDFTKNIINDIAYKITIDGLTGGHSGSEIDKERANSNILLGRLLYKINQNTGFEIVSMSGGTKDNVITNKSEVIITAVKDENTLNKEIDEFKTIVGNEYAVTDSKIKVSVEKLEAKEYVTIDEKTKEDIIFFINAVPNGAVNYCGDMKNLVETSLNMGVLTTTSDYVKIGISVRSLIKSRKEYILNKLIAIAKRANAKSDIYGEYPQWEFNRNSHLQEVVKSAYLELFNEELKIEVIHAGLECGYLLEKKPDLDILSFGPQMYDIHTVNERLSIKSTENVYKLVLKVLEYIK
ncbi:MAG: aminoacyl-histidine dipeptidase [Lachnospiraceae bacterium]|nr:aminoacyl-histidine dipeptidase [Lachnospiraceae bacterium]